MPTVRKIRTVKLNSKQWQRIRAEVLASEPLCRHHSLRGHVVPATEIDHHDNDGDNNDLSNLVPLCKSCHSIKTARFDRGLPTKHGFGLDGLPLDPDHPWSKDHQQPTALERRGEPHTHRREIREAGEWQA
ncbi:HNH endonuclease signature motif containing protein [Pseudomonas sp. TMP25]|uniref:HNH endonuclease signature motif containing protein n=1 Tax=Pseudomonas sp. TMP25 TaxID=3136561 RepID=UPI003100BC98